MGRPFSTQSRASSPIHSGKASGRLKTIHSPGLFPSHQPDFEEAPSEEGKAPDIATQMSHAAKYGHSFAKTALLQRQPEDQEEELERKPESLQRQGATGDDDDDLQPKVDENSLLQSKAEEEDNLQPKPEEEETLSPKSVQAKLTIGQPGDKYEQEADRTAAQVMQMPEPKQDLAGFEDQDSSVRPKSNKVEEEAKTLQQRQETAPLIHRQPIGELEKPNKDASLTQLKPSLQAKGTGKSAPQGFEQRLNQHRGGGQPLPDGTRSFMESRFGADFGGVRVHEAPQEAADIGAQAFTHGQDIYFNAGKYNPGSSSGKELLAHELTHTIQQTGGKLQRKTNKVRLKPNKIVAADIQARSQPQPTPSTGDAVSSPATFAPDTDEQTQKQPAPEQPAQSVENQTTDQASPVGSANTQLEETPENKQGEAQQPEAQTVASPGIDSEATGAGDSSSTTEKPGENAQPSAAENQHEENSAEGAKEAPAQPGQALAAVGPQSEDKGSAGAAASEAQAPASPDQDPDFQAVVAKSQGIATEKKQHAPAAAESQAAQAAAESPENEVTSQAQDQQVADMEQQESGTFDAEAFKQAVMSQVDAAAPKTLEDADQFKDEGLLGKVKETLSGEAKSTSETAKAPIAEKTEQEPDTSGVTPRESTPLAPPETGAPPNLDASAAKPKPKPESEVSAPMQAESQNLDQQMAEAEITDEQLATSGESQFVGALSAKQEAQTKATEAPQIYRQQEQATLTSAQSEAQNIGQTEAQGMQSQREAAMSQLQGLQEGTKSQDEQKRSEVATHIDGIYQATKSAVNGILDGLEEEVMGRFNTGADQARSAYEDYVAPHMEEYKKRYDGIWGAGRWVKDKLLGVPSDVTAFFREGRKQYLEKMDEVLTDISTYVTDQLNLAKEKITEGRQEIKDYVEGLPTSLQQVGQEAASNIQSKFDELEQSVDDKHDQLVTALSQAYTKNLEELDARIEEMKASNQPWFAKAFDALTGVIETINKLKNMLTTVLAKVADTVGNIIKDPIGFLNNLVTGVTQGLNNFLGKIWDHLQGGLVGWLTGALGPMGITIPEDIFSLQGIFSLVTQVLGLTWNYVRGKAVKMFGEPTVGAMEQGVEMIQVVKEQGPEGMWEQVKEDFNDLQATVIDQIKNMVITQVITAGVKWIIGLLNPASAFVKACMAIYDIVMFFINQGSQILELVNAITDAVAAIAKGAVGGAAQLVEGALVKALPVAIGFLASLLGVSGLAKKVQGIIKKIRKRIDKAINKLLRKAKNLFKKKKKKKKKNKQDDQKAQPDERSKAEKQQDLDAALSEAKKSLNKFREEEVEPEVIEPNLAELKRNYRLKSLNLHKQNNHWSVKGEINPKDTVTTEALVPDDTIEKALQQKGINISERAQINLEELVNVKNFDLISLLSIPFDSQEWNHFLSDKKTPWRLFLKARNSPGSLTKGEWKLIHRVLRGAAGELVFEEKVSQLFPGYKVSDRQVSIKNREGVTEADFEITSEDDPEEKKYVEVKAWSQKSWDTVTSNNRSNLTKQLSVLSEESDGQAHLVLEDVMDQPDIPDDKKKKISDFLASDKIPSGTSIGKISSEEVKRRYRQLMKLYRR
jgi:Skp family chaperone for outer membrane proteins